jgi:predicted transcriptional regulator
MIDRAEKIKNTDITNLMAKRVITIAENQPLQEASRGNKIKRVWRVCNCKS